ncbi:MAG: hypothetical protein ABIR06_17015 [Cyclobacteriaceae bacterium]
MIYLNDPVKCGFASESLKQVKGEKSGNLWRRGNSASLRVIRLSIRREQPKQPHFQIRQESSLMKGGDGQW